MKFEKNQEPVAHAICRLMATNYRSTNVLKVKNKQHARSLQQQWLTDNAEGMGWYGEGYCDVTIFLRTTDIVTLL